MINFLILYPFMRFTTWLLLCLIKVTVVKSKRNGVKTAI